MAIIIRHNCDETKSTVGHRWSTAFELIFIVSEFQLETTVLDSSENINYVISEEQTVRRKIINCFCNQMTFTLKN